MDLFSIINSTGLDAPFTELASLNPAIAIPFVAILTPFIFVLCIVGFKLLHGYRMRKLQHEMILHIVEKGQPIPPELLTFAETKKVRDDRRTSLILIAVGIGLFIFFNSDTMLSNDHFEEAGWLGAIPGLIGVALLLNWFLEKRDKRKNDDK